MSRARAETAEFFDEMAPRYDSDLVELGWDPIQLVDDWPFVVQPGMELLDAGCGTGALLEHFTGANRGLAGFDVSPAMIRYAHRRRPLRGARLEVASADEAWPFADASFDRILAIAMFEFVDRLDVALDELARVLRPGGRALVSVEDVVDWGGVPREAHERRYDRFGLWRRTREELEMSVPPAIDIVRVERLPAYTVLERGFTSAYWVAELAAR